MRKKSRKCVVRLQKTFRTCTLLWDSDGHSQLTYITLASNHARRPPLAVWTCLYGLEPDRLNRHKLEIEQYGERPPVTFDRPDPSPLNYKTLADNGVWPPTLSCTSYVMCPIEGQREYARPEASRKRRDILALEHLRLRMRACCPGVCRRWRR